MNSIKDSVHDHIQVEGVAAELLDTPAVQRLRHVSQLGTASLVYPSANHTRFEHSLGVYHLASEAMDALGVAGQQAERVRAAALLHDVGHGPFSHNLEDLIHRRTGRFHDDVEDLLATGEVGEILRDHGLRPAKVAGLVAGDGELGQVVSGELDVDRMDYLVRDAHHTGVPYGTIDTGRLVRELRLRDGELVLAEGNVQTAEALLLARALMNPAVYNHHVTRIGKAVLQRGTERLLEETDLDAAGLSRMDDHELLVALRDCEATTDAARRLTRRDLLKRAVWAEMDDVPERVVDADHDTVREFERAIAEQAGVDRAGVVVDVPPRPSMTESSSRVVVGGEIRRLDRQSTLVSALQEDQRKKWRLGVYAPAADVEAVGAAAADVLDVDGDGGLVSDVPPGMHARLDEFGEG